MTQSLTLGHLRPGRDILRCADPNCLALTLAVGACFGDPPPDAENLPLEIVVHPDECLINYPQVGPGIHEVTVIFEGTSGLVSRG